MTAYADYTYYTGTFGGTEIASSDFAGLANKATAHIDRMTFDRAAAETDGTTVNKIKMAMCAVAEEIQRVQRGGDAITSESVGGHSVSYAAGATATLSNVARYANAARLYLANTGLMFAGFYDGEYGEPYTDED